VICIFFIIAVSSCTACLLQMSYDITSLKEHLQGARAFLNASGPIMTTSVQRHVEMATAAAYRIEKEHDTLKRKLKAIVELLRKLRKTEHAAAAMPVKNVSSLPVHVSFIFVHHTAAIIDKLVRQQSSRAVCAGDFILPYPAVYLRIQK